MRNWIVLSLSAVLFLIQAAVQAQPSRPDAKVYRDRIEPHWIEGNTSFWYRLDLPDRKREFILVDASAGSRKPAFDHRRAAEVLKEKLGKEIDPERLPFDSISFSPDGKRIKLIGESAWSFDLADYLLKVRRPTLTDAPPPPCGAHPLAAGRLGRSGQGCCAEIHLVA